MRFGTVVIADWSARTAAAPARPARDALWWCVHGEEPRYERTRGALEAALGDLLERRRGRALVGFDFSFSYPRWFLEALGMDWRALWAWLEREIRDEPGANNRFAIAEELNRRATGEAAPFWGTPRETAWLKRRRPPRRADRPELRGCEAAFRPRPKSAFQLWGAGSVGSQTLLGIPALERLRRRFAGEIAVWPFEAADKRIVLAEVYPSCLPKALWSGHPIPDREQVRHLAAAFHGGADLAAPADAEEGGILAPPAGLA